MSGAVSVNGSRLQGPPGLPAIGERIYIVSLSVLDSYKAARHIGHRATSARAETTEAARTVYPVL